MGMYTALHFAGEIKKDAPKEVTDVLNFMANITPEVPERLPEHSFFETSRWRWLFVMDSAYFSADTHWSFLEGSLTFTSNIKNYSCEIEKFIDWIDPYLTNESGEFLGYSIYEEDKTPTLIYKK